jgi:hypothetical protein
MSSPRRPGGPRPTPANPSSVRYLLHLVVLLLSAAPIPVARARSVVVYNDRPRVDVNGDVVDAHDGMLLAHGSPPTYFLYGESYQNTSGPYPWGAFPQLSVYTSQDLVSWTPRGPALLPGTFSGTGWIPNVLFDPRPQYNRFVMWFGTGDWSVATSTDGVAFTVVNAHTTSRLGGQTDGTGLFVDDDGTGYVIFAALVDAPGLTGHVVSIERLADDYLSSTKVNVSGFFPDGFVESPALFKRNGTYYATYGNCCCACRGGGGIAVFTAPSVLGPWTRQAPYGDINCADPDATVCGSMGPRSGTRPYLVYNAQWWGVSLVPTSEPGALPTYVFTGRRWLSGVNNPPGCDDLCSNNGNLSACVDPAYQLRTDLDVWAPLSFGEGGEIAVLENVANFTLDVM